MAIEPANISEKAAITKRAAALMFIPILGSILIAVMPSKPPAKMRFVANELALFAAILLCMGLYDLLRRLPYRRAIPLAWLTTAGGFGCFSMALRTMAQSWGLRLALLPIALVGWWLGAGTVLLLIGTASFGSACQKRAQMA